MEIRKATMADLEAITAVEAECFPVAEAATREDFAKRLAVYPDHFWLLVEPDKAAVDDAVTDSSNDNEKVQREVENRIIGFVNGMVTDEPDLADEMYENASLHKEDGKWQMIFGVNTIPEYRRRGYAELVLKRVIEDARNQGREGLVLTCKDKLLHYYGKLGFVNEGVSKSVHGNVVWYQMRLKF